MFSDSTTEAVATMINYNINKYTILLSILSAFLWVVGYGDVATICLLTLIIIVVVQNTKFAYDELVN